MAVKQLRTINGQNHGVRLAPDLTWANDVTNSATYESVTNIDASSGLTTVLSLTGRWEILSIYFQGLLADKLLEIKLTVDGIVIWTEAAMADNPTTINLFGAFDGDNGPQGISCDATFLLEFHMDGDSDIDMIYWARPIL
jgi:hypothetical protein